MSTNFLVAAICFVFTTSLAKAQPMDNPVKLKSTIKLDITKVAIYGYQGNLPVDKKRQPITNREDALEFINLVQKNEDLDHLDIEVSKIYNDILTNSNSEYAILLLRHPLDLNRFFEGSPDNLKKANQEYKDACDRLKKVNELLVLADKKFDTKNSNFKTGGKYDDSLLTPAQLLVMNNLSTFRSNLLDDKKNLEKILEESRKLQKDSRVEIVEDEKIESYILNKENDEWQDYILDKKKILIVFIGGIKDLVKTEIKINNKPSSFKTNLNELFKLTEGLGIVKMDADESNCSISDNGLQALPVTFVLINQSKIKPPSDLELSFPKIEEKVKLVIHEKARFGIKVGFSASFINRKNFSLSADNKLTIQTDSLKKEELKSNLMAIIEWIPWGRDIDRLEPVWSKNKDIKAFALQRFGLAAGIKISKDPLQAIYGGISYSLSKEAALNFGIGFYATAKDVKSLPVGVDATLDYLKDNADRKLEPKIFFGISFSPGQISKSLGIIK
jgi:hypothetical protein